jgi:hypothetical protein
MDYVADVVFRLSAVRRSPVPLFIYSAFEIGQKAEQNLMWTIP